MLLILIFISVLSKKKNHFNTWWHWHWHWIYSNKKLNFFSLHHSWKTKRNISGKFLTHYYYFKTEFIHWFCDFWNGIFFNHFSFCNSPASLWQHNSLLASHNTFLYWMVVITCYSRSSGVIKLLLITFLCINPFTHLHTHIHTHIASHTKYQLSVNAHLFSKSVPNHATIVPFVHVHFPCSLHPLHSTFAVMPLLQISIDLFRSISHESARLLAGPLPACTWLLVFSHVCFVHFDFLHYKKKYIYIYSLWFSKIHWQSSHVAFFRSIDFYICCLYSFCLVFFLLLFFSSLIHQYCVRSSSLLKEKKLSKTILWLV